MSKRCFIMGLPGAGKTTFLAALWHSINNNSFETKLKLARIDNGQYLARLSQKWVDAEELERTMLSNEQKNICIKLKTSNDVIFDLFFPDLSGETFQKQYEERFISEELAEYIKSADAIMFFIHVDEVKPLGFISEHFSGLHENRLEPKKTRDPKKHDPLQVQTIELLQFIMALRKSKLTNVSIVFSAWDLIKKNSPDMTPNDFLHKNMNMLGQFCYSNLDVLNCNIWGISAQGADYSQKEALLEKTAPIERILVEDSAGNRGADITLPLYLLMGESK
jgi:adenylate kinase family enzyme